MYYFCAFDNHDDDDDELVNVIFSDDTRIYARLGLLRESCVESVTGCE